MNEYIGRSTITSAGGSWASAFGRPAAAGAVEPPAGPGRADRIRGAQAIQGARAARAATATATAQATARAQALQNRAEAMLAATETAPGRFPIRPAATPTTP
ncbi:hypothetical protein ACIRBZ_20640 [Streptomyces sp. NPDC094038]|uniref:hypothetical protein n=1 Tax=Streptomyces sp. NPDC094038 TaxID=3366055 RepID=UPI003811CE93